MKWLLVLSCSLVQAQTQPSLSQFRNIEQLKIVASGDARGGTLVSSRQVQDGRHVRPLSDMPKLQDLWVGAYLGTKVVCVLSLTRIASVHTATDHNMVQEACFSQLGQMLWLQQGNNDQWYVGQ